MRNTQFVPGGYSVMHDVANRVFFVGLPWQVFFVVIVAALFAIVLIVDALRSGWRPRAPVFGGDVLSNYALILAFALILWLPLLGCVCIVRYYSNDPTAFDAGTVLSTYCGILLLGCLYTSLGIFASAVTRSQIIAAMFSFAVGIALFMLSFLSSSAASQAGWQAQLVAYFGLMEQMRDFAHGVVDSRPVVLSLTLTVFFLLLSWKTVESRRWK